MAVIDVGATLADPSNPLIIDRCTPHSACRHGLDNQGVRGLLGRPRTKERGRGVTTHRDCLEHRDGDPTVVLCTDERERSGDLHFDDPITALGRRHVLGRCSSPDGRSSRDCLRGDAGRCTCSVDGSRPRPGPYLVGSAGRVS